MNMNSGKPYIRLLDNTSESAWNQYVDQHKAGTLFHSLQWRDILLQEYRFTPTYMISETNGHINGILPLFRIHNLSGKKFISLPLSMYGGPLTDSQEIADILLNHAQQLATENNAILKVRVHRDSTNLTLGNPIEFDARIEVSSHEIEGQLSKFPALTRRSLRRAWKNDLTVRIGGTYLLEDFHSVLSDARRHFRMFIPRKAYYHRILEQTSSGIIAIYCGNRAISTCLYLYDKKHLHYAVPAVLPEGRHLGAGDLCVWELLKLAQQLDRPYLCLGGSPVWHKGLIAFKNRWGSVQSPLYNYPQSTLDRNDTFKRQGLPFMRWLPNSILEASGRTMIRLFY